MSAAVLAAVVAAMPAALLAQETAFPVGGIVRSASGAPVAGASVSAGDGKPVQTGADGRFTLQLPRGRHVLRVAEPSHVAAVRGHRRRRPARRRRGRAESRCALRGGGGRRGGARRCRGPHHQAWPGPRRDRGPEHGTGDAVPAEGGAVGHAVLRLRIVDGILVHVSPRHSADADERHARRRAAQRAGGLGVLLRELRRLRQCHREPPGAAGRRHVDGRRGLVRRIDQLRQH